VASNDPLIAASRLDPHEACAKAGSAFAGLSDVEAAARLKKFGPNLVARERKATVPEELWSRARNPLNALLLTLAFVSYFLGDIRAAVVIAGMVVLAITTAFIQEHRSNEAAARLRAMVHTTASAAKLAEGEGLGSNLLRAGALVPERSGLGPFETEAVHRSSLPGGTRVFRPSTRRRPYHGTC